MSSRAGLHQARAQTSTFGPPPVPRARSTGSDRHLSASLPSRCRRHPPPLSRALLVCRRQFAAHLETLAALPVQRCRRLRMFARCPAALDSRAHARAAARRAQSALPAAETLAARMLAGETFATALTKAELRWAHSTAVGAPSER